QPQYGSVKNVYANSSPLMGEVPCVALAKQGGGGEECENVQPMHKKSWLAALAPPTRIPARPDRLRRSRRSGRSRAGPSCGFPRRPAARCGTLAELIPDR